MHKMKIGVSALLLGVSFASFSQTGPKKFEVKQSGKQQLVVLYGGKLFTAFLYPDTLEKPILYPVLTGKGSPVTRGFPLNPRPEDPTDHPHHSGVWFTFENVNGLDFWNNSYAIPAEKKGNYGWIKTDKILSAKGGNTAAISYHANWMNQQKQTLLEEKTTINFSGDDDQKIIDRTTILTATRDVIFKDAKDGMYAIRLAKELQIPSKEDAQYRDNAGNVTTVEGSADGHSTGNYLTSQNITGDSAWSSRGRWCKNFGKIGNDSVSVVIIDHPDNVNYPTFWHARGYGLFAANPLGTNIFTNGKLETNLELKEGQSVTFKFRMVIQNGDATLSPEEINRLADEFATR